MKLVGIFSPLSGLSSEELGNLAMGVIELVEAADRIAGQTDSDACSSRHQVQRLGLFARKSRASLLVYLISCAFRLTPTL